MGSQRVGHDWPFKYSELFFFFYSSYICPNIYHFQGPSYLWNSFSIWYFPFSWSTYFSIYCNSCNAVLLMKFFSPFVCLKKYFFLKYIFAKYRNLDQHLFFSFFSQECNNTAPLSSHAFFQCEISCYPYLTILKMFSFLWLLSRSLYHLLYALVVRCA